MNYSVLLLQTARVMFQAVMGDINIKLKKFCIRSKLEKNLTTDMLMEQRRNTMAWERPSVQYSVLDALFSL